MWAVRKFPSSFKEKETHWLKAQSWLGGRKVHPGTGVLLECWHGCTAQERKSGTRADQLTIFALHQKQHPWHMARDERKRANTQRDALQEKDKREGVHGKVPTTYSTLSSLQTLVMTWRVSEKVADLLWQCALVGVLQGCLLLQLPRGLSRVSACLKTSEPTSGGESSSRWKAALA
eukprot:1155150-Pelagomonas_calceolata.AAC.2